MNSQSDGVVDDATNPATETEAEEQTNQPLELQLLQLAKEEGLITEDKPAEDRPVSEEPVEEEVPATEDKTDETSAEEETEEEKQPEKPVGKGEPWPDSAKARVAEETEKRRRANDRADRVEAELQKAQALVAQLQASVSKNTGPRPTEENPLIDIQDTVSLDRLEREYENVLDIDKSKTNEDGLVPVFVERDEEGKPVYKFLTQEQVEYAQRKAERALRKDIPRRREYLVQRSQNDAKAFQVYPELGKPETDFSKEVAYLAHQVLSGNAQNNPELLVWIGHAIYGYHKKMEELKGSNGKVVEEPVKELVRSARTPIAPTASRTRSLVERRTVADQKQAKAKFEKEPTEENAVDYVGTILAGGGSGKKAMPPIA